MKDLRIIYMGTPEFAVPSLEILIKNKFNVVAVVTAPDKPSGRGLKLTASPVKTVAIDNNIPVLQPTNLKSAEFLAELKNYNANLQIVVAFRMLPEAVWRMPELGTFNLHASLLPQYRGAAPINWAIINGEQETGVTTFFLKHDIDTGDVIFQEKTAIGPDEDLETIYKRLMSIGANLVLKTVQSIRDESFTLTVQNPSEQIKHAPKIFKEDCEIDFSKSALAVKNFVRGLSPFPGAWTVINGKQFKILKVEVDHAAFPGNLEKPYMTDNKSFLKFKTGDGQVSIKEIQMEGKKRMPIEEFFRGNKLE